MNRRLLFLGASILCVYIFVSAPVFAHGVHGHDQKFITSAAGAHPFPFMYLGAKHMVTGYDHLAYLAGVVFFLHKMKDIFQFVSLFAIGHSMTLLLGVLVGISVNPYMIDAVIGLSVCYKALENLDVFKSYSVISINPKKAVFTFGLVHGFGLSSKLQDLNLNPDGLIANMISFNIGVEIGQIIALIFLMGLFVWMRSRTDFDQISLWVNMSLFMVGLVLFGYQLTGFFVGEI